ncbi:MAG TPA: pseudouridine synthase [bacterium]|nr:pseudouridine synthase [bacterium]
MKFEPIPKEITLRSLVSAKSSQTLLEFLVQKFKYLTREEWEERIVSGKVKVNDREASAGQPLRAGDEVAYTTNSWEEPAVKTDYRIVFEDDHLLIVSKPAPLPVHAIGAYFRNTLTQLLRRDRPEAQGYHLVHRLDSETSGLLALVKDAKYLKGLQKQWSHSNLKPSPLAGEGRVRGEPPVVKTYRAIVFGRFPQGKRVVDAPIGKKEGSLVRMKLAVVQSQKNSTTQPVVSQVEPLAVNGSDAKASVTEFELLEGKQSFSLIQAKPLTGRTHQIRVHLEHLGFPIVGDKLYSGDDETFLHFYENDWDEWLEKRVLLPRAALHAFKLEFPHPVTGERLVFEDSLPGDLARFWESVP